MNQESPTIALFELRVWVDTTGILIQRYKYPTGFTGKNYIRRQVTDELEAQGYHFGLYSRVSVDDIMKVRNSARDDTTASVGREIYYLEGQEDKAKELIRAELDKTIQKMNGQMVLLHESWVNRKERPRHT